MVAWVAKEGRRRPLERVFIPFLDLLPTAKHPVRCHQKRVLREERGQGGGGVVAVCLVTLLTKLTELTKSLRIREEITLLGYSWIDRIFLLGKDRRSKADCQSCKGK